MKDLSSWRNLLKRQAGERPLRFTHGMRHEVKELYCHFHSHDDLEIVYHPVGWGTTRLDEKSEISFEEGSVVIYAPSQLHDQRMAVQGEDLCVKVELPKKIASKFQGALYVERFRNPLIAQEIESLARVYPNPTAVEQMVLDLRATAVLMTLIHEASSSSRRKERSSAENYVIEAERYIRENYQSLGLLDQVARHISISHDRLRHVFKEIRGKPLIRYVNEVRLDRAKSLLIHSPLPLKQIATMCGYKDEYYFSAVFKRFTGQSAGAYRKRIH